MLARAKFKISNQNCIAEDQGSHEPVYAAQYSGTQTSTFIFYATEEVGRLPHESIEDIAPPFNRHAVDIEHNVLHEFLYMISVLIVQKTVLTKSKIYVSEGKSKDAFRI